MIKVNERLLTLECTLCGRVDAVSPKAMADPAKLSPLKARFAREHERCASFATPARAKAERIYREGMRAAFHGIGG